MSDADRARRRHDLLAGLPCIEPPAELDRMLLARARVVLEAHAARQRVLDERSQRRVEPSVLRFPLPGLKSS
jgi:hypothetical protein